MTTIPNSLRSLFTARIREQDGRYRIEIPANEIEQGTLQPGDVYRVAVLDAPDAAPQEHLEELFDAFTQRDFYVCGVPPMVVQTKERLAELGATDERIHSEGWEDSAVADD